MTSFTCISCRVAFKEAEIQRLHYKTDWHRYNLKRKVAELPPVTSDEFQRRVLQQRSKDESQLQDKSVYCKVCRKSFGNSNAFENHLHSKKHRENERNNSVNDEESLETIKKIPTKKLGEGDELVPINLSDSELEEIDSDEWGDDVENPVERNDCLFCSHHSGGMVKNLKHMSVAHSFFIPDAEYCVDIHGLLCYLGEKIVKGFMCLWCNEKGRTFHSAESARQHMIDKGHCKMIHEGIALAEYSDYYDYSTSYPDAADNAVQVDEEVEVPELDASDYQLVLPSGITVGHRSLMRYYKQSIDPSRAVAVSQSSKRLHKVLASYRALGWSATQQDAAAKKARDIHYMKRLQSKLSMKLSLKANKMQPHYRAQVNF